MRRLTAYTALALLTTVFIAAAAPNGVANSSTVAACKPGPTKINGVKVYVYCGPAKAAVKLGSTKISFANGTCVRAVGGTWAINVGTVTVPPNKPKFKHFGITIGKLRGAGAYQRAAIGFEWNGKTYGVTRSVVVVNGTKAKVVRGTFSGRLEQDTTRKVTGSFTC